MAPRAQGRELNREGVFTCIRDKAPFLVWTTCKLYASESGTILNNPKIKKKVVLIVKMFNRAFSNDIKATILVSQNNEMAAMLVYQTNPVGIELLSYLNTSFCSNKFAFLMARRVRMLYFIFSLIISLYFIVHIRMEALKELFVPFLDKNIVQYFFVHTNMFDTVWPLSSTCMVTTIQCFNCVWSPNIYLITALTTIWLQMPSTFKAYGKV